MNIFILDDEDRRHNGFRTRWNNHNIVHCYRVDDLITEVEKASQVDIISLDYHLDGTDLVSGDEAARLLCEMFETVEDKPLIVIHSNDRVGIELMKRHLSEGMVIPFNVLVTKRPEDLLK